MSSSAIETKRENSTDGVQHDSPPARAGDGWSTTNFRNVSADPVTKRAIPRSYVYYLENRVRSLELLLQQHDIPPPPPEDDFAISDAIQPGRNVPFPVLDQDPQATYDSGAQHTVGGPSQTASCVDPALQPHTGSSEQSMRQVEDARAKLDRLVSDVGMVSVRGTSDSRYLGSTSGISFARVVFAAVKSSVPNSGSERSSRRQSRVVPSEAVPGTSSMRDSFFGLQTKPSIKPAPLPVRTTAQYLVELYFEYANPQIPILHRGEFDLLLQRVYSTESRKHTPRELYLLNIVLAIGSGIILESGATGKNSAAAFPESEAESSHHKRQDADNHRSESEEYHSSAVVHLESFLGSSPAAEDSTAGGLEELQAVLLLASLALLRPVAPGLWYIVGVALDDKYVTTKGFLRPPSDSATPSYKLVARHYLRLRLLQSEIVQVLQYRQAEKARMAGANRYNDYIHKSLPMPFLQKFSSFRDWRFDIDRRLREWKEDAPQQAETGVLFSPLFLELNYWQAIVMLYRQSLAVPEQLANEISPSTGSDVHSPGGVEKEAEEDEQYVFMKVAQAGQMILKTYRVLHRQKLVNYTYLATHHLFMGGISFLYAIWHSKLVRSQITIDDVDFSILAATSVLNDLAESCPPAEACRDAFVRMSKATIAMVEKTTGFGDQSKLASQPLHSPQEYYTQQPSMDIALPHETTQSRPPKRKLTMPKFDMNLRDLFGDDEMPRPSKQRSRPVGIAKPEAPLVFQDPLQGGALTQEGPTVSHNMAYQDMDQAAPSEAQAFASYESMPQMDLDNLANEFDFLNALPTNGSDSASMGDWDTSGMAEFDQGFGTGGMGSYDINGEWDPNGFDLFGGFFFGGNDGSGAV